MSPPVYVSIATSEPLMSTPFAPFPSATASLASVVTYLRHAPSVNGADGGGDTGAATGTDDDGGGGGADDGGDGAGDTDTAAGGDGNGDGDAATAGDGGAAAPAMYTFQPPPECCSAPVFR